MASDKPEPKKGKANIYIRGADQDLYLAFRAHCVRRRVSVKKAIQKLMRDVVHGGTSIVKRKY